MWNDYTKIYSIVLHLLLIQFIKQVCNTYFYSLFKKENDKEKEKLYSKYIVHIETNRIKYREQCVFLKTFKLISLSVVDCTLNNFIHKN